MGEQMMEMTKAEFLILEGAVHAILHHGNTFSDENLERLRAAERVLQDIDDRAGNPWADEYELKVPLKSAGTSER